MDENNRQSGPQTDKENVPDKDADKIYAQQAQNGTTESGAQDAGRPYGRPAASGFCYLSVYSCVVWTATNSPMSANTE